MKLSKEKKDKLVLVCLLTVMALGVYYTFIIGAQRETLADLRLKSESLADKVDKARRLKNLGPRIEENLATARAEIESKEGGMAPADKNRWFFNTVIMFMEKHGVSYETSTPEPIIGPVGIIPAFPFQAATFGVVASGRFHDAGSFVASFENTFPYMRLTQMRMQPAVDTARASTPRPGPGAARVVGQTNQVVEPSGLLRVDMRVMTLAKP